MRAAYASPSSRKPRGSRSWLEVYRSASVMASSTRPESSAAWAATSWRGTLSCFAWAAADVTPRMKSNTERPISRSLEPRHLDAINNELHRDRAQHEPHEAGEDAHPGLPQPLLDAHRPGQGNVAERGGEDDRDIDPGGGHRGLRGARKHHHGGDRARPGEHRHAQRHDSHVLLLDPLGFLDRRLLLRRACTMSSAVRPISTPPAILKAPSVIPNRR